MFQTHPFKSPGPGPSPRIPYVDPVGKEKDPEEHHRDAEIVGSREQPVADEEERHALDSGDDCDDQKVGEHLPISEQRYDLLPKVEAGREEGAYLHEKTERVRRVE